MKARYPEVFTSYDSFKSYVRANKLTEVREEYLKSHVRYETEPGEEVQIDWKESIQFTLSTGEVIEFNLFAAVFGYSRYTVFIYSRTKTTEDFIRCMIELMIRTGGVPRSFKTDNMSAIVSTFQGRSGNCRSSDSLKRTLKHRSGCAESVSRSRKERWSQPTGSYPGLSPTRANFPARKN